MRAGASVLRRTRHSTRRSARREKGKMADNYSFKKRQRELAQKKKREEKLRKKMEKKNQSVQPDAAANQSAAA